MRKKLLPFLCAASLLAGCTNYQLTATIPSPGAIEGKETMWSLGWGAVDDPKTADLCPDGYGINNVRVQTNLGYDLISVVTLGFARPIDMFYRCYAHSPETGRF